MLRVARRGFVLNEWHLEGGKPVYNDHWLYSWKKLFSEFTSPNNIKLTKIPPELWPGDWAKYGYVVEISLN